MGCFLALFPLGGLIWPAGRGLPTPGIHAKIVLGWAYFPLGVLKYTNAIKDFKIIM